MPSEWELAEAIEMLHQKGLIQSRHWDGMLYYTEDDGWIRPDHDPYEDDQGDPVKFRGEPVYNRDDATRACLIAMLREATKDPFVYASSDRMIEDGETRTWQVWLDSTEPGVSVHCPCGWVGNYEGEAIANALITFAHYGR